MNNNETAKFIYQDINIDVIISVEDNTVWLSKEQIALLFKRDRSVISKRIKMIEVEKLYDFSRVCAKIAHTAKGGKEYDVAFYNLEIVIEIGRRTKSEITTTFYAWCIEKLSELNHKNMMESNIIRFNNDNLSIDVQIFPGEQTVWLSQNQIAILFDSTQQNISLHIKNIINENELDFDSVHKEYLYAGTNREDNMQKKFASSSNYNKKG